MIDFVRTIASRTSALVPLRRQGKNGESSRVRYAVVGLGYIAQSAVLPAFAHARRNSELTALVSDSRTKLRKLGDEYDVHLKFTYDEFDALARSGAIDAVYNRAPQQHAPRIHRAGRSPMACMCSVRSRWPSQRRL